MFKKFKLHTTMNNANTYKSNLIEKQIKNYENILRNRPFNQVEQEKFNFLISEYDKMQNLA